MTFSCVSRHENTLHVNSNILFLIIIFDTNADTQTAYLYDSPLRRYRWGKENSWGKILQILTPWSDVFVRRAPWKHVAREFLPTFPYSNLRYECRHANRISLRLSVVEILMRQRKQLGSDLKKIDANCFAVQRVGVQIPVKRGMQYFAFLTSRSNEYAGLKPCMKLCISVLCKHKDYQSPFLGYQLLNSIDLPTATMTFDPQPIHQMCFQSDKNCQLT